jgi:hypothetical protein
VFPAIVVLQLPSLPRAAGFSLHAFFLGKGIFLHSTNKIPQIFTAAAFPLNSENDITACSPVDLDSHVKIMYTPVCYPTSVLIHV